MKQNTGNIEWQVAIENLPRDFFILWYRDNGRRLPWRREGVDFYGILLAELLLRQTRADRVSRVWETLTKSYPTIESLYESSPDEILTIVEPLGLGNQRTKALLDIAEYMKHHDFHVPEPEGLIQLPHIGVYMSNAISCFAYGLRVPVVDINIIRLLSRITGICDAKDIRRCPAIWTITWALLPPNDVASHNYGMLDYCASICKSSRPVCSSCVLSDGCVYFETIYSKNLKVKMKGLQ